MLNADVGLLLATPLLFNASSVKLLNKISAVIVLLNLSLHYFFISSYQAVGAGVTVLITEWTVGALVIYASHRSFPLPHNFRWLLAHIGFVFCTILLAFFCTTLSLHWMMQLLIVLFGSFVLLFFFRFWTISSIKELLQRKERVQD